MNLTDLYMKDYKEIYFPCEKPKNAEFYYKASIIVIKFTNRTYNNLYYIWKIRHNFNLCNKDEIINTKQLKKLYEATTGYLYPLEDGFAILNLEDHYQSYLVAKELESKGYGSEERVRRLLQMGPY